MYICTHTYNCHVAVCYSAYIQHKAHRSANKPIFCANSS